jgi:hypothetical protein
LTKNCPTCGQLLPPANPFHPRAPVKARIYEYIAKHPEGVSREQVRSAVYDDAEGGPESDSIVSAHVLQMNRVLASSRCKIHSTMGHGAVYTLRAI